MTLCYAVTSGDYSNYSINCIFATEEDATKYAIQQNEAWARSSHGYHHKDQEFESCTDWPCKQYRDNPATSPHYEVEPFDYYQAGEYPAP